MTASTTRRRAVTVRKQREPVLGWPNSWLWSCSCGAECRFVFHANAILTAHEHARACPTARRTR